MKTPSNLIHIVYCSRSEFKKEEWSVVQKEHELSSIPSRKLGDFFKLENTVAAPQLKAAFEDSVALPEVEDLELCFGEARAGADG